MMPKTHQQVSFVCVPYCLDKSMTLNIHEDEIKINYLIEGPKLLSYAWNQLIKINIHTQKSQQ